MTTDRLNCRPTLQRGALFGDPPPGHLRVRLAMAWCESCLGAECLGRGETGDITDLRDEDRRENRSDTDNLLDRNVTEVTFEPGSDLISRPGDLCGEAGVDRAE